MPTEQSQLEYYHYYRASQRRVQQWVQKTSRELEVASTTVVTGDRPSDFRPNNEDREDAGRGNGSGSRRRTSRRRSSSSSKRQNHDQVQDNDGLRSQGPSSRSRSTRKKVKASDIRSRGKPYPTSDGLAISSLLSFGLLPLIFILTPPSVATLFSATILLAGYFCVDYGKKSLVSEKL